MRGAFFAFAVLFQLRTIRNKGKDGVSSTVVLSFCTTNGNFFTLLAFSALPLSVLLGPFLGLNEAHLFL